VAPIDWLVGFCGAALIGSLWLPWYRAHGTYNAWQAMAVNDLIFLVAGGLAITVVVVTVTQSSGAIPIAAATFTAIGGTLAAVLALVRVIWPPDLGPGPTDRAAGVWIGAAAALALAVSGWFEIRDERRAPEGSTNVEITTLPAPKAEGV
jgi:hypothetical protein